MPDDLHAQGAAGDDPVGDRLPAVGSGVVSGSPRDAHAVDGPVLSPYMVVEEGRVVGAVTHDPIIRACSYFPDPPPGSCGLHPRRPRGFSLENKGFSCKEDFTRESVFSLASPLVSTMEAALIGWGDAVRLHASERAARTETAALKDFVAWSGIRQPHEISAQNIEGWLGLLRERGFAAKTIRNMYAMIHAFCCWGERHGLCGVPRVLMPRREKVPPNFLPDAELAHALQLAESHGVYAEVAVAAYCGLRMNELRMLLWLDVDQSGKRLVVRKPKSKRFRTVWIPPVALAALHGHRQTHPDALYVWQGRRVYMAGNSFRVSPHSVPQAVRTWLAKLAPLQEAIPAFRRLPKGSTGRGWHLLRHTYVSRGLQRGVPIGKISKWAGHASVAFTLDVYGHLGEVYDPDCEKL